MPGETDPAGAAAPLSGVPFTMAARMRRVAAESPPWVRHWRSYARTRRRKTRESELGGAAPKVCSQTRRKLAKSKPSKTTFRPTPVSCGITEHSLFCSIKSSLMRDFRVRSSLPVARPAADLSQPCAPPVGLSLATRSQGSEESPEGRLDHRDHQRAYLERLKRRVTDQGRDLTTGSVKVAVVVAGIGFEDVSDREIAFEFPPRCRLCGRRSRWLEIEGW